MASAWDALLIADNKIKNIVVEGISIGYEFNIHGIHYRGIYLSCIESLHIRVDGREIGEAESVFAINGKEFLFSQLKEMYKEYWMSNKTATIRVFNYKGLPPGSNHEIEVDYKGHMPFGIDWDHLLSTEANGKKTLQVS
jgi:hypothetical protein